jgi:hypothetical protein
MRPALLWALVFTGPLVWFAELEANFALAPLACQGKNKTILYIVSGASLLLLLTAGIISWAQWYLADNDSQGQVAPFDARTRGLALGAVALNFLAALVVLAQTIPNLMMTGCE